MVDKELEQIRKDIKAERAKISKQQKLIQGRAEKKKLQRELDLLRSPGKARTAEAARRIKVGLKDLAKKTGRTLIKQGRLIKEQQEREASRERALAKRAVRTQKKIIRKKPLNRLKKKKTNKVRRGIDPFDAGIIAEAGFDFFG